MVSVRLDHVGKRYDAAIALSDIDLEVADGELFFLLGPSGCGKSTLLRLIAGLIDPTEGRIFFGGREVTRLPTQRRNAVMCFQNYALWPHMTVRQNVAFGLNLRPLTPDQRMERAQEALHLVQLDGFGDRKPAGLSGGEQQRVALARAIVVRPDVLLLDEPLSNLDAKKRNDMRGEIRSICKSARLTTIYVTHDQTEALSIGDRIAIMQKGKVIQIGKPAELYDRPKNSFVADFLGQTNLIKDAAVIGRVGDIARIQTTLGVLAAPATGDLPQKVVLSVRPQRIRFARSNPASNSNVNSIPGQIIESLYLGEATEYIVQAGDQKLKVVHTPPISDSRVILEWDISDTILLPE
jgi:iron(III) transport system ATP-binding protein